jgi:hypothetical protein
VVKNVKELRRSGGKIFVDLCCSFRGGILSAKRKEKYSANSGEIGLIFFRQVKTKQKKRICHIKSI